jgi:tetratricopeptide (TPR) repeat protein
MGIVAAVLVAATLLSTVLYFRAERAAVKATQVSSFLSGMLAGVGPQVAQGRDTKLLRDILDKTAARVGAELADQPEVEAALRLPLGDTYRQLGEYDAAQKELDRALELQKTHGLTTPEPAELYEAAGNLAWNKSDLAQAADFFRKAVDHLKADPAADPVDIAEDSLYLGDVLMEMGEYDQASTLLHASLEVYEKQGKTSDAIAVTYNSLGNLSRYQGDLKAAEEYYRKALATQLEVWGENHPFVATDYHNLGRLLDAMGRPDEAEQSLQKGLAIQRRVYDGPHPDIAMSLAGLSDLAITRADYAKAEELSREAWDTVRRFYGEDNEITLRARLQLAGVQARSNLDAAEATYRELLAKIRSGAVESPSLLSDVLYKLASCLATQGRTRESLPYYTEAIEHVTATAGPEAPDTLLFRNDYARALSGLGDDATAITELRAILAAREKVIGPGHPQTAITRVDLGKILGRNGGMEEAEQLIRRGRDDYAAAMGEDHPGRWIATTHLGSILRDLGRYEDSEKEFLAAHAFFTKQDGEGSASQRSAASKLSTLYLRWGKNAEAETWLQKALGPGGAALTPRSRAGVMRDRGEALLAMNKAAAAEKPLLEAWKGLDAELGPANADVQYTVRLLVRTYEKLGRGADASQWKSRLA